MKKAVLLVSLLCLLGGVSPLLAQTVHTATLQYDDKLGLANATTDETSDRLLVEEAKTKLACTGVGYPTANSVERAALAEALAACEAADVIAEEHISAVSEALAAYEATTDVQLPEDGKVYRIAARMADGTLCYVYRDGIHGKCSDAPDETNNGVLIAQRLSITSGESTELYRWVSGAADAWFTQGAGFNTTTVANLKFDKGVNFGTLRMMGLYGLKWRTYVALKVDGVYKLDFYTRDAGQEYSNVNELESSDFVFEEITDWYFPANVYDGSLGDFGTLHLPFASIVPQGVTAYALELSAENDRWLEQVRPIGPGETLPAETPVLLQGEAPGTYEFHPAASQGVASIATGLKGTLGATHISETAYILAFEDGVGSEIMFYLLDDADRTVGSNKAYWVPTGDLSAPLLRLGRGNPTAIESITLHDLIREGASLHDLCGRRVHRPHRGGIYVCDGRKIIVK